MFTGAFNPLVPVPKQPQGKKKRPNNNSRPNCTSHWVRHVLSFHLHQTRQSIGTLHCDSHTCHRKMFENESSYHQWVRPDLVYANSSDSLPATAGHGAAAQMHTSRTSHTRAHTHSDSSNQCGYYSLHAVLSFWLRYV